MGPQTRTPNNCKGNRVSAGSLGCWMQGLEERKPNSRSLPSAPSYPEMGIATSLLQCFILIQARGPGPGLQPFISQERFTQPRIAKVGTQPARGW